MLLPLRNGAVLLIVSAALARGVLGGLWFHPAPSPSGADVAALTANGAELWAGTSRGVWRLSSGVWSRDGLADRPVTGVAVSDGALWAATGEALFRRGADGSYAAESLPSATSLPTLLVADGGTLYVGGFGVARRSGGAFAALPSPGPGLITAMALEGSALVVGLSTGGAARFNGASWSLLVGGMGPGEGTAALASFGGALYAGTSRGVYVWSGAAWVTEIAFGIHDVRSLAAGGGSLHAATSDAGVFRRSGSSWVAESSGLLTLATSTLAGAGGDLYLGTLGGPVYLLSGGTWSDAGPGSLNAATVSDVLTGSFSDRANGDFWVATRGSGLYYGQYIPPGSGRPTLLAPPLPNPCGDVAGLAFTQSGGLLAATGCGPFTASLPSGPFVLSSSGLGQNAEITSVETTPQGVLGGTAGSGVFRFQFGAWSADDAGLPPNAFVTAVRLAGSRAYAALGPNVWERGDDGRWANISGGLRGAPVLGFAGDSAVLYAGLSGGVSRRLGGRFYDDSAGVKSAAVFSLDLSAGRVYAAAGESGVLRKDAGGWLAESFGLPAGVDVRVVRDGRSPVGAGPLRRGLFAGTAGHGLFFASTAPFTRTLPIVLDTVGAAGARFRSELTLGSRSSAPLTVHLAFRPAGGLGAGTVLGGTVDVTLAPGTELHASDALELLRTLGLALPAATPERPLGGSLTISADRAGDVAGAATEEVYAIARTYTVAADGGSYGVFYDAPSELDAAEEEGSVYGLRSAAGIARSNLALVHLPGRGEAPITLRVDVYDQAGALRFSEAKELAPGEWHQFNGILGIAGLPDGSYGYVRIVRVGGAGAWSAYGVVNDGKTSDGSILPLFRPGGIAAARRLVVPVVLDVYGAAGSHFTTELTLVNDSPLATPVDLVYRPAPDFGSSTGVPVVTINMAARQQLTIADVVQYLREHGLNIPDPRTAGSQAGTLSVTFRSLTSFDAARTVALARTSTANPDTAAGGTFGLFYPAAALGGGALREAVVPALTQDVSVRSNLAVVHLGGGSELAIGLSVQLYDAGSGKPLGTPLKVTLNPGDWYQWSRVLEAAGLTGETTRAIAVVTRTSGDDTFYAYGVLNDNVTSDGSFLPMMPVN